MAPTRPLAVFLTAAFSVLALTSYVVVDARLVQTGLTVGYGVAYALFASHIVLYFAVGFLLSRPAIDEHLA